MLSIFQNNNNQLDIRSVICRFNIISYGSFLLIYPILLFTNLNIWLFIIISCFIFPQIYVNALSGTRPNLNSPFYSKFLMFRFLIIVKTLLSQFYLKGNPFNIFHLKPDYLLCIVCLLIVIIQVFYFLSLSIHFYGFKKYMDLKRYCQLFCSLLFLIINLPVNLIFKKDKYHNVLFV